MTSPKNRFGTPNREAAAVKERFSSDNQQRIAHLVEEAEEPLKRKKGYKGKRKPVTLRLPIALIDELAFVSFAGRSTQQDICERAIQKAVQGQIKALEASLGSSEMANLKRLFHR